MVDDPAAPPRRGVRWAFFGPNGLRAGWRILVFCLLLFLGFFLVTAVVTVVAMAVARHFHQVEALKSAFAALRQRPGGGGFARPEVAGAMELVQVSAVLMASLIMARFERKRSASYGLALRGALPRFFQGLLTAAAMLTTLLGLLWWFGGIAFTGIALQGSQVLIVGAEWGGVFLLVGAAEELLMRGYVLQTIARGLNFRWAAVITSVFFTVAHLFNPGESASGLSGVFLSGLVFSFSIWRTGTIWWAVGYHAAWDWTQTFVFGVADSGIKSAGVLVASRPIGPAWLSGGSVGPEGSALLPIVLAATACIVALTLRKRDQQLDVGW